MPELNRRRCRLRSRRLSGRLGGYFHERIAKRVRDDLFCNVVVLKAGDPIVIVSLDIIGFIPNSDETKRLILAATGIPCRQCALHATHTHTGPIPTRSHILPHCAEWIDACRTHSGGCQAALADLKPVIVIPGRENVRDAGSVRVCRQKSGKEMFGRTGSITRRLCDRRLLALRICDLEV